MPVPLAVETTPGFRDKRSEFEHKSAYLNCSGKRVLGVGDSVFVGVFDSIEIDDTLLFDLDLLALCEFDVLIGVEKPFGHETALFLEHHRLIIDGSSTEEGIVAFLTGCLYSQ